jgi:hypothetical protein
MGVLQIRAESEIIEKVKAFLKTLNGESVELSEGDDLFVQNQMYLRKQLSELDSGKSDFLSLNEASTLWDATIKKHDS